MRSPWARAYEETPDRYFWGTEPSALAREAAALIHPPGRVLELGSGEGRDSVFLAARGLHVTAVEVSAAGIRKAARLARERGVRVRWVHADAARLVVQGPFELVLSCGSIHYVPRRPRQGLLRRLAALTAAGGVQAHLVFTDRLVYRELGETIDYFSPGELAAAFPGWSVLRSGETTVPCSADGTSHRHSVEELVARKP
jgi:tellurite methyltransferase